MVDEERIRQKAKEDGITHFATGIAVFQDGKLLVVRRVGYDDFLAGEWELPGGGVDIGETIEQGAARELKEETNLDVGKVIGTFEGFDYSTPKKTKVRQINFRVSVKPGDIALTEHDMFKWITVDEIIELRTNAVMQSCLINAFE